MDQDINGVDNSSDVSESQSIDINSINLNNNASNDCDSSSIEIHNTSMLNTTLDNHLDSGNIATRVRAKNQSGHFVDMSRCGRLVNQVAIWVGTQVFWVESVCRENA